MKKLLLSALLALGSLAPVLAQVRPLGEFRAVRVGSGIELTLTGGHAQRVEVSTAPAALAQYLTTTVENGTLVIGYQNPNDPNGRERSRQNAHLRVAVTADQLTALTAGSGSVVQATGRFTAPTAFKLAVSSGAAVAAELHTDRLTVEQSSGSTVKLDGEATALELSTGSGSTFNGKTLQTSTCRVQASSGSAAQVAVKDNLVAEASSGSSIHYYGAPQVTKHVSGGASVSGQ